MGNMPLVQTNACLLCRVSEVSSNILCELASADAGGNGSYGLVGFSCSFFGLAGCVMAGIEMVVSGESEMVCFDIVLHLPSLWRAAPNPTSFLSHYIEPTATPVTSGFGEWEWPLSQDCCFQGLFRGDRYGGHIGVDRGDKLWWSDWHRQGAKECFYQIFPFSIHISCKFCILLFFYLCPLGSVFTPCQIVYNADL